jgi:predicted NBD/HSP70 family sugar kinase
MVHFNAVDNYVVGLDWGRTHIQLVLTDLDARIVADLDEPVFSETDFDADTQLVIDCINRIIGASGIPPEKILGIGGAAAGYVSSKTGVIEFSPNFGWHHADISKALGQAFDKPVKVDNVSRVMAMGELCYVLGQTIDSFLFVNIGYGIGSGIFVDGKPMTGFDGYSGEIGHTRFYKPQLAGEDRKCVCGKTNCLECFASGRGIAETAIKNACHFPDSLIHQLCGGKLSAITTEMLARAARAGDSFALDIFNESAEMIGLALANYSNAFNPQAVIIAESALAGSFFYDRIRHVFESERLQHVPGLWICIFSSIPGKEAVKGAVALVLQEVLELI